MPPIDKNIIDRILEASRIEEVVGDFVTLKKKGVRYIGCCPFHEDRHAGSFVVYPAKQCYKCFVCDEKGGVVEFLKKHEHLSFPDAIRWLGKKYNIETDMTNFKYTPPPARPAPPSMEMLVLPMSLVTARQQLDNDNLISWLRTGVNWDGAQRKRLDEMLADYHVGHSKQGMTIWWQIDEKGRVRTGKMMLYKADGHRDKDARYSFDWVHSALSRRFDKMRHVIDEGPYPHPELFNPDKQEMKQCLFGLHLLNKYKMNTEQTVHIVESEKSAVIMAISYGNHCKDVWMATGGIENLTREKLKPLIDQHRRIVCYPDRDGIQKWEQKVEALHYDRIIINTDPVLKWWRPDDGPKADIADVVVRMTNSRRIYKTVDEVVHDIPKVKALKEKFGLEISKKI